jgi:cytoskeletal protein CcmA (bactofilin family)
MWRKPAEAKPSSDAPLSPAQNTTKTVEVSQPVIAPAVPVREPVSAPAVAATPAPVAQAAIGNASKIGAGLKIHGEISGTSDLYIDGAVQGKIHVSGARVTVGPQGRVEAQIDAREIVIQGSVQGSLNAAERLQLGSSSHVAGNVRAPRLAIEDGARLRGKAETTAASNARESAKAGSASSSEDVQALATVSHTE